MEKERIPAPFDEKNATTDWIDDFFGQYGKGTDQNENGDCVGRFMGEDVIIVKAFGDIIFRCGAKDVLFDCLNKFFGENSEKAGDGVFISDYGDAEWCMETDVLFLHGDVAVRCFFVKR